jgi:tRNA dimethylallyltransferase
VGPTAVGKSGLVHEVARETASEIINCDSVQAYEHLQIGAAKPTSIERQEVLYHLLGFANLASELTAGDYYRKFMALLSELNCEKTYFVVGGTGFYFQALEKGLLPLRKPDPELRAELEREVQTPAGAAKLYEELRTQDPSATRKIHPQDHYRLVRAIEVYRTEGRPMSEIHQEFARQAAQRAPSFPHPYLKVGLRRSREDLRQIVRERVRNMLEQGLIAEVQHLRERGFGGTRPLASVGYHEVQKFLDGAPEIPDEEALIDAITTSTMQLAKKQMTWFKRDSQTRWFDLPEGRASARDFLLQQVKTRLED